MTRNIFMSVGWFIAKQFAGLISLVILFGTPVSGAFLFAVFAWYGTGGDLPLAMAVWFALILFGSLCVYSPYLQPLTLRLVEQVTKWMSEQEHERWKKSMRRQGVQLKDEDPRN